MPDHKSDCAVHNAPAKEPCDCGAVNPWMTRGERDEAEARYHLAVELLNAACFKARFVPCFAKPGEQPGYILVEEND